MSSPSLPCPVCAAALTFDPDSAGKEQSCPSCGSLLRIPADTGAFGLPEILRRGSGENPGAALPSGRPKTSDDELRRLAGAASAAGGAHSFTPEEAAQLAAERAKTILPDKRRISPDTTPAMGAAHAHPTERRDPVEPGMKRFGEAPPEPKPALITPLSPKIHQQVDMSPTPLTGAAHQPAQAPPSTPPGPPAASDGSAKEEDAAGRAKFRLNDERTPQLVPQEVREIETDAKEWGGEASPQDTIRTRRMVTLALAALLILGGAAGVYLMRHAFEAPVADAGKEEGIEDPMINVKAAREVLKRFLAAPDIATMAAEVRHPEETRPRMERYYASRKITPLGIRNESAAWGEVKIGDKDFINNTMELDDFNVYAVSLEIVKGGPPKVDWESFVNWSEIPWADFLSHPPDDAMEFRVSAVQDDFYSGAFTGKEFEMLCFKLRSPKKSQYEYCYGYCDKNSEVGTQILFMQRRARQSRKLDEKGKPMANCILRLRFSPEGKQHNQVLIEKMIFQGWIQP